MATSTQLAKGGLGSRGAVTVYHSGDAAPSTATTGTDTTPAVTETYISRVQIPVNSLLTGISLLNGSAVAGNVSVALYNQDGQLVAQSASVAQSGTAAYQAFPFASQYRAHGPGLYFAAVQFDSTSARFRTHTVGVFTTTKQTAQTYGTFTAMTSPNSFTTGVGPICSTY